MDMKTLILSSLLHPSQLVHNENLASSWLSGYLDFLWLGSAAAVQLAVICHLGLGSLTSFAFFCSHSKQCHKFFKKIKTFTNCLIFLVCHWFEKPVGHSCQFFEIDFSDLGGDIILTALYFWQAPLSSISFKISPRALSTLRCISGSDGRQWWGVQKRANSCTWNVI